MKRIRRGRQDDSRAIDGSGQSELTVGRYCPLFAFADRKDSVLLTLASISMAGILFCSGSAAGLCYSSYKIPVLFVLLLVWGLVYLLRFDRIETSSESNLFLFLLVSAVVVGGVFNGELLSHSLVCTLLAILGSYFMCSVLGGRRSLSLFVHSVVFVGVFSLLGYLLIIFDGYSWLPRMASENGKTVYANAVFFCIDTILNKGRSIGVFWEPSIMAGFVNIALYLVLVFGVPCSRLSKIVLLASLFVTQSSGGLIGFALVLIAYNFSTGSRRGVLFASIAVLAVLAFLVFYDQIRSILLSINYEFFFKFYGGQESGTTQTRLDSPLVNLRIWAMSPLTGFGIGGANELYRFMRLESTVNNMAQTSTMTAFMSSFGLLGASYTVAWFRSFWRQSNNAIIRLMGFCLLALVLNEVPCMQFMGLYLLLFALLVVKPAGMDNASSESSLG